MLRQRNGLLIKLCIYQRLDLAILRRSNYGLEKAKDLSEAILSLSMIIGLIVGGILGHVIDKCQIAPVYILCFMVRGLGLFMMTFFITDFEEQKGLLYFSFF